MNNQRLCFNCNVPMRKTFVEYKSLRLEARECPKCKEKIFTEDLAMEAISQLEAQRLEREYVKHPIKIGQSWGITFPKDMVKVFGLNQSNAVLRLHPNVGKKTIEISLKN